MSIECKQCGMELSDAEIGHNMESCGDCIAMQHFGMDIELPKEKEEVIDARD